MNSTAQSAAASTQSAADLKRWAGWVVGVGIWLLPLLWINLTTYLVLTVAGVTMGMLLFLTASGFTIILGLMDVINLAHGAFFAWGAYTGFTVLGALNKLGWVETGTLGQSLVSVLICLLLALAVGWVLGVLLEWLVIRRTYGSHLKQILITMGAALVMAEVIAILWGPNDEVVLTPAAFTGSLDLWDVVIEKFRLLAILVGGAVFLAMHYVLQRTKLGIIVRGGVENREMVQALGHNIRRIFTYVFAAGAALAAMGGTMWSIYTREIRPDMGESNLIFALIVVVIGGMGSVTGCFLASLMVGLAFNYVAYSVPTLALGVNIMIMAVILLLRPSGLMGRS
ncbi:MAG: branched-chain amino acid ABC transporter permease [Desulfarculus sp.]|jgi:branched-chain amino acid transport system permease protein|nr:MAG: branched-chain amino acid ABC transporter permease [Desulfarculus sp.]